MIETLRFPRAGGGVAGYAAGAPALPGVGISPEWLGAVPAFARGGFLDSAVPGRTDHLPIKAMPGSYVIPADVVSGIGEGNSRTGALMLDQALGAAPFGIRLMRRRRGRKPKMAEGGAVEPTDILAAGGEYIVPAEVVRAWGGGDIGRGHRFLDQWVVAKRKEIIDQMQALKGPVK